MGNSCLRFYNVDHLLDPISKVRRFRAAEAWPTAAATGTAKDVFDVRHVHDVNVHALDHYLIHPNVHAEILGSLCPSRFRLSDYQTAQARTGPDGDFPNCARPTGELVRRASLRSHARDQTAGREAAAAIATRTYQSYEDLLYRGLPMWPWELKLNERFVPERFDMPAPERHVVVMRPNLSLALLFNGSESSEVDCALTVEPIGFVKYRASDYTKWWGASLLVGMTDDNGRGYGAQFRWDDYTLGLARHDRTSGDDEWVLYVSIDLFNRVLGEDRRTNSANAFLTGIKERIQEGVIASPDP